MAVIPFWSRRTIRRNDPERTIGRSEHGPAARLLIRAVAEEGEREREKLRREIDELRQELGQEKDVRRVRAGGVARVLGDHSRDIGSLAERVIRLEHPEGDGPNGGQRADDYAPVFHFSRGDHQVA